MERFLRYSLERDRAIRVIYLDDSGAARQVSAKVTALSADEVTLAVQRPRQVLTLPLRQLLSADYRKGDEGEA